MDPCRHKNIVASWPFISHRRLYVELLSREQSRAVSLSFFILWAMESSDRGVLNTRVQPRKVQEKQCQSFPHLHISRLNTLQSFPHIFCIGLPKAKSTTSKMCIQIYRRCICGHRENNGPPRRCQKVAAKSSSFLCFVPFAGPRLDDKGFCLKKKEDSFGVPEPCRKCIAEGGIVNHLGGQSYYYDGGAQGLAPLPPPKAYVSSSYSRNERHHGRAQMSSSRHDTQAQQPQVYREPAQRSTKYENPDRHLLVLHAATSTPRSPTTKRGSSRRSTAGRRSVRLRR